MKKLLLLFAFLATIVSVHGQDANLKMHFDFSNASGTSVVDNVAGITARTISGAKVVEVGKYHALQLGDGTSYLNMSYKAGQVMQKLKDFSVSACYYVSTDASLSGAGYFLWTFSSSQSNTQTSGAYFGYRLNEQSVCASANGWDKETNVSAGYASQKGRWINVVYRQNGQTSQLIINGQTVAENSAMPAPSDVFKTTPNYNWLGRSAFSGDSYLKNVLIADFRVYDGSLTDAQVADLAAMTSDYEKEYKFGGNGDMSALTAKMSEAQQIVASASSYAPNAVAELQDVLILAQAVVDNGKASQPYIDDMVASLENAIATCKATEGYQAMRVFDVTLDHGFVHPGGIVSQEDIDRAKSLIAAGDERMKRAWEILCNNEYSHSDVATWPTEYVIRGGGSGQNYMNCARGAAMAFQNALRWKIGGDKANADGAVRILMQWARACKGLGGDTNVSLAAGIYGHEFANAAELMRDYEGWSREDFEEFKRWIIKVFYNPAIDFLRRRHDTWLNARYANLGERPGHYWSNWGLCNALCVMSIGILCDDVHMYNQGVSFYKYDHVGTFKDRTNDEIIYNDGCNEFIGNLVPVLHADDRGPFGYLGQMQESGRDQGHTLMALGLAVDICQVGLTQGDDLYAYMNDRIAAGAEFVAAMNFGDVDATTLPWTMYEYADCRGTVGSAWKQAGPNTGGSGEFRPYWDRLLGYYEGLRGVKMQYTEAASAKVCPDGGGGNYSQNSGGFDNLGFSTLTGWRPAIDASQAITPLSGDIKYNGRVYKNQTNLGGLKYTYEICPSKAIPADGAEITLMPQLPDGATDSGNWLWSTGEKTRDITVKADRSYIYRVTYTAANGAVSRQSFAIAVAGDAAPDVMTSEVTVDGNVEQTTDVTILSGNNVTMTTNATTGWVADSYLWDNGTSANTVTVNNILTPRSYTCQYANQSGAVSESKFNINVVPALQYIGTVPTPSRSLKPATEITVLKGADVTMELVIPMYDLAENVTWPDGSHGTTYSVKNVNENMTVKVHFVSEISGEHDFNYNIELKQSGDFSYYDILTAPNGYSAVVSTADLTEKADNSYFVLASDDADLLVELEDAPNNGNKALFLRNSENPTENLAKVFMIESYGDAFCMRNIDYDGLLLQTEWDRPDQLRTHDQPFACEWTRLLMNYENGAWTMENGKYPGNWFGLWTPANGYQDGEEMGFDKKDNDIAHFQIFAIDRERLHSDLLSGATADEPVDATPLLQNPAFVGNGYGWSMTGQWGNQRYNGAAEVWHSTNFNLKQTVTGLPNGHYELTCQMVNGEGVNSGVLYAQSGDNKATDVVSQSCAGSNFDAERDKMAADAEYGKLSVEIDVTDGTLTLGIIEPTSGSTWLVFDNFTLTYYGAGADGITSVETNTEKTDRIYDLSGRRLNSVPARGLYIKNGKVMVK